MNLSLTFVACLLVVLNVSYSAGTIVEVETKVIYHPESCLDIKYLRPDVEWNGFYTIYDSEDGLHTVYCDFNSEKPYVWTLVESFSRKMGIFHSQEKGHSNFQRSFAYDYPYNECRPDQFDAYRASLAVRKLIASSRTTTHWRATCNFDKYAKGKVAKISHKDYMRTSLCWLNVNALTASGGNCYHLEYINLGGHSCSNCLMPFWTSSVLHLSIISSQTATRCSKIRLGHTITNEYNWGAYKYFSQEFSCTETPNSTTNWWFGGVYSAKDMFHNVKKA